MFLTVVAEAVHASQDVLESVDDFLGMDEFSRLDQGLFRDFLAWSFRSLILSTVGMTLPNRSFRA